MIEKHLLDLNHLLVPKYFPLVLSVLAVEILHVVLFLAWLSRDCWRIELVHYHGLNSLLIAMVKYLVVLLLVFVECHFLVAVYFVHLTNESVWLRLETHRLLMYGIRQIKAVFLTLVQILNETRPIKKPGLRVILKRI